ncbi:hypothetical protein [Pelagibacterium halotolerans]|uniref:Uncharacterized protein n=1 Tax=Pelagibacterium halotolerans (strain DSM 22347 / JCM 15775 / CGMCC 1.7692 / B2) TaxID=1082931 RepID=G4R736_PELHB|nr:hypothetical protein [Pelagibacterium halotolerans]AEQ50190.1 hypothetical protein KKY_143 [Pelagibacterium halotolerans B2]SEA50185.1 hypothetical protein SAMN05428936_104225 [Pelagibacterium halotolerans]
MSNISGSRGVTGLKTAALATLLAVTIPMSGALAQSEEMSTDIPEAWAEFLPQYVIGEWDVETNEGCFSAYFNCYESQEAYNAGIEPKTPFPLTEEARAFHDEVVANLGEGRSTYDPNALCYPQGMPDDARDNFTLLPDPRGDRWYLLNSPEQVRTVWLDGREMPERETYDYTFWGDSVGHFEGDTLVIETRNITGPNSAISPNTPKSDNFWVIERWTPVSADEMTVEITFMDEERFTEPYTESFTASRDPEGDIGRPSDPCITGVGQRYIPDPETGEQLLTGPGGMALEFAEE